MGKFFDKSKKNLFKLNKWMLILTVTVLVASLLIFLMISPWSIEYLMRKANTALSILIAYRTWSVMVACTFIFSIVIIIILRIIVFFTNLHLINKSVLDLTDDDVQRIHVFGYCHNFIVIVLCYLTFFYLKDIKVFTTIQNYSEDITAIQDNNLLSADVFFSDDPRPDGFVNYNNDYPDPFYHYKVIGTSESGEELPDWDDFYVPNQLNDSITTKYNENGSREWNEENMALYRITYTPNQHIVISVEAPKKD